jgi:hypothetical protein
MGKREVGFAITDVYTEASVTFGHCKRCSDRVDIDTTGFTLTHMSNGQHELYIPSVNNASGPAYFYLYVAADPSKYVEGVISPTHESVSIADLRDEALGKWTINPSASTLTLLRADGITVLKTFSLANTSDQLPAYISRTPQ